MIVDDIRGFREAIPFRPYKLVLASGEELPVPNRGGIAIAPEGRYLVYALEPDGPRILRPRDVRLVEAMVGTST